MATRSVELAVKVSADASAVAGEFDGVGSAARRMADDVDTASSQVDASTSRLDGAAESADNLGSKSAQAAGGLGDLGGALAGVGGPVGAFGAGMEAAATPVMGLVGAADLANLALGQTALTTAKAKVATVAHTAVTKASTVAQRALNLVLRANPLGIVITLLVALAAAVVVAYNKSETFRRIVDKAMAAARSAIGTVVDAFGKVKDVIASVIDWVGRFAEKVIGAIGWVKDLISKTEYASSLGAGLSGALTGTAGDIGDQIRGGKRGRSAAPPPAPKTDPTPVNITVSGNLLDPAGTARALAGLLRQEGFAVGSGSPLAPVIP